MSQDQRPEGVLVQQDPRPLSFQQTAPVTPASLLAIAVQRGASLDELDRLMTLQERMMRLQAEQQYNEAFARFRAETITITKGRKVTDGPLKGKSYAELHDVIDAVAPALSKHGLSLSWKITKDDRDWLEVTCFVKHVGGHSESVSLGGPPDTGGAKNAIQARASTVTYLERYTAKAILGVAEGGDDTDGNAPRPKDNGPDESALELTLRALLKEVAACETSEAALRVWKAGNGQFLKHADLHDRLKEAVANRRRTLGEAPKKEAA